MNEFNRINPTPVKGQGGLSTKPLSPTQRLICDVCAEIQELLLDKNRKYGDSAIHPVRIFSKADPLDQIDTRIDDKLSRILSGQEDDDEDVELDLIGYLVLKRVAKTIKKTI